MRGLSSANRIPQRHLEETAEHARVFPYLLQVGVIHDGLASAVFEYHVHLVAVVGTALRSMEVRDKLQGMQFGQFRERLDVAPIELLAGIVPALPETADPVRGSTALRKSSSDVLRNFSAAA